jgi:hypothetical protein
VHGKLRAKHHGGSGDEPMGQGPVSRTERAVFFRPYTALDNRIKIFTNLRLEDIDALSLQNRLDEIGQTSSDTQSAHP